MRSHWTLAVAAAAMVPILHAQSTQTKDNGADWPMYNRDLAGTRYSPLAQINTKNVAKLAHGLVVQPARGQRPAAGRRVRSHAHRRERRDVSACGEPRRGARTRDRQGIWRYVLKTGTPSRRGVTYWPGDRNNPPRIIFTTGSKMMALNAKTGTRRSRASARKARWTRSSLTIPLPPFTRTCFSSERTLARFKEPGSLATRAPTTPARARNCGTFHSVPQPGEVGHESWQGDGWKDRTGVNNWGFSMTVDTQRNLLYTTFGSPASDFYGGDRKGNDLFGNSVVALDADTGKMKWYFQAVHHDTWDFDLPPAPGLIDVTVNGKKIPDSRADRKSRLHVHPEPADRRASIRNQ